VIRYALNKILELQQEGGGWLGRYEIRVVPTLITLELIPKKEAWQKIREVEEG